MRLPVLVLLVSFASGQPAIAGVVAGDCAWLEFTSIPAVSISTDTNTVIYQTLYAGGPAHETVVRGEPPQARFWAFAILDQARREIANLSDFEIELEDDGTYEVVIRMGCEGVKNCIDLSGAPVPVLPERLWYRMYVPDLDRKGGVPLPRVEVRMTGDPTGPVDPGLDALVDCTAVHDALLVPFRPGGFVHEFLAAPGNTSGPVCEPAANPAPERYEGAIAGEIDQLEAAGAPPPVVEALRDAQSQGDFGATRDNAYVTIPRRTRDGNLVIRAKAPTYRKQHPTAANDHGVEDGREEVRYWSLCTTAGTRPIACLRDEHVVLDDSGFFEVVVSPVCPLAGYDNCLLAGRIDSGQVFYRNTLASGSFFNDHGPRECPTDRESIFCGDYTPVATYLPRDCD